MAKKKAKKKTPAKSNELISLSECARRLKRSRALVSRWAQQDRIPTTRIAGQPFVLESDCKLPEFLPPGRKPKT